MKDLEEQRVCVKFCFKLGKNFTEAFQMLQQVYGKDCLSRTQCHEWYQRFKSGRTSIEDDPKSGRPSTSMGEDHIEKVHAVIRPNRRSTIREVAEVVGISKSSYHLILTDKLQMHRVTAKFVPHLLTDTLIIREFLMKHDTTVVPQPPYSPDLAPADFFFFPKCKSSLKVRRFQKVEEIEENLIQYLRAIPQNTFQKGRIPELEKTLGAVYRVEGSTLKETSLIKL